MGRFWNHQRESIERLTKKVFLFSADQLLDRWSPKISDKSYRDCHNHPSFPSSAFVHVWSFCLCLFELLPNFKFCCHPTGPPIFSVSFSFFPANCWLVVLRPGDLDSDWIPRKMNPGLCWPQATKPPNPQTPNTTTGRQKSFAANKMFHRLFLLQRKKMELRHLGSATNVTPPEKLGLGGLCEKRRKVKKPIGFPWILLGQRGSWNVGNIPEEGARLRGLVGWWAVCWRLPLESYLIISFFPETGMHGFLKHTTSWG